MRKGFAAGVLGLALIALPLASDAASPDTYRQLNLFGDVFERIRSDYVEEVGDQELIEAAINGMLSSLDPHSSYLNAKAYKDMQVQTRGEFGGLGIEVTMENGLIKVISPIEGSPADDAGVLAGDLVTKIDGDAVMGLTLSEAVDRMRGPAGTEIIITVRRGEADPFDVVIVRDIIRIDAVRHEAMDDVAYIRIKSFSAQTETGLKDAMRDLNGQIGNRMKGVVLDLRNNPGGLLSQAIAVSDAFLERGEIVSTRGRSPGSAERHNAKSGDITAGKPLVVLINSGSASASEIVAGALQDHQRAIVMGTRSFGKGSVQTVIPLSGHGAMRLTTSRYYTPSGRSIQALGIEPDIKVEQSRVVPIEATPRRSEADLRNRLRNDQVDGGDDEGGTPDGARSANKGEDYQLQRALDLLRGVAMFKTNVAFR